jgi:hypothetical protein
MSYLEDKQLKDLAHEMTELLRLVEKMHDKVNLEKLTLSPSQLVKLKIVSATVERIKATLTNYYIIDAAKIGEN